jgi:hypothetical protein
MKISVDDQDLYTLSEVQKKVIKNDIHDDEFEDDVKRRLKWVLHHKYEQCFKRLKEEWDKKLPSLGIKSVPTNEQEYAELVFSQKEYKSRKQKEEEFVKQEEGRKNNEVVV